MSDFTDNDHYNAHLNPLRHPLGDSHHTDVPMTPEDKSIGQKLAWHMGDLFIDGASPREQWQKVARALRIHGLTIVDKPAYERRQP